VTDGSPSTTAGYQVRSFRPGRSGDKADAQTTAWLEAAALGFLEAAPSAEHMARTAEVYETDERVLTGAYAADSHARAWQPERPVGTYGTFVKSLNVGHGQSLDAHLIATVTVRPNHRRRGLLRDLMSADLVRARDGGLAIALLGSMEATIYGRFGFGPAIFSRRIEVDTSDKFSLRHSPAGSVEVADPATLIEVVRELFDGFHDQTLGSLQRPASYPSKVCGIWAEDQPESDRGLRAALHYDPTGEIDGYVTYKFLGWDSGPRTISILDLVWKTEDAYLGLWDFLASVDQVTRVLDGHAPMDDALPWAMVDRRGCKTVGEDDGLWVRVLDPVAALQARRYEADGDLRLGLSDPLGIADGVYAISVRDGRATVTKETAKRVTPDVSMDVSALGSLYLGGARTCALARAGRLTAKSSSAVNTLDVLLAHRELPYCITHF
jgi:predicted acetyltransferase